VSKGRWIGPGKAALLEAIRETGSISEAARRLGMAYRRAWELANHLNTAFTTPVVETAVGGRARGGARLTPFGAELLARYRRMEKRTERAIARDLAALARRVRKSARRRRPSL
jgi:molybdate transport system regulatory protein